MKSIQTRTLFIRKVLFQRSLASQSSNRTVVLTNQECSGGSQCKILWKKSCRFTLWSFLAGGLAGIGYWLHDNYKLKPLQAAEIFGAGKEKGGKDGLSRRDRFNFVADVVSETAPALVNIKIKDKRMQDFYTGDPVTVSCGSGFLIASDGLILTNAHVVESKPRTLIEVQLLDGRTFLVRVEDLDRKSDLATIRIDCKNLPVMKLGHSSDVRLGEFVMALGSPLSLSNTITSGVISSVARNIQELPIRGRNVPSYIQTDATITFGNSGGPLINLDGEAIGVNSMKITHGISFAIPIDHAKDFLRKCQQRREGVLPKQKSRRYMGVTMLAITPQILNELYRKIHVPRDITAGILVCRVVIDSPSDAAGVQPGDIITHINGIAMYQVSDVYELLETTEDLQVTIRRGNKTFQTSVKPEF